MNTYVYIDGFNLYYNAVRNTPYKWLDLYGLSVNMFPKNDILKVKYFTAEVRSFIDTKQLFRQKIYIKALLAYHPDKIEVYKGHFTTHWKKYRIARKQEENAEKDATEQSIWVIKTEEKGSDVNLAVHLLNDARLDAFDAAIIFSNDSDLTEALKIVKEDMNKVIGLVNPNKKSRCCAPLNQFCSFHGKLTNNLLNNNQLPAQIPGTNLYKPPEWC